MHKKGVEKLCKNYVKHSHNIEKCCKNEHEKIGNWEKLVKSVHNLNLKCYNKVSYIQQEVISWLKKR